MRALKDRVKKALEDKPGSSPAGLARACRISRASVSGWLSGDSKTIKGVNLVKAAEYLGVTENWLATGEPPMRSASEGAPHGPSTRHIVAEPPSAYIVNNWPFETVVPHQYRQLSEYDRGQVEGFVRSLLNARGADKSDARSPAAPTARIYIFTRRNAAQASPRDGSDIGS